MVDLCYWLCRLCSPLQPQLAFCPKRMPTAATHQLPSALCNSPSPAHRRLTPTARSFAALDAPGGRAADIAPLFAGVLQEEAGAEAADKARALAGLAMCALIDDPPSLETARSLVANAKEVCGLGGGLCIAAGVLQRATALFWCRGGLLWRVYMSASHSQVQPSRCQTHCCSLTTPAASQASPSEVPAEVARAEALIELANDTEAALADPRSTDQLQAAVEADKRDHEARYALALRQFAAGQHQAAVDSALVLVRQDRWVGRRTEHSRLGLQARKCGRRMRERDVAPPWGEWAGVG